MSRLPVRSSSPESKPAGPSMASTSLKRKAIIEEEDEDNEAQDQPRKLPAFGLGDRPTKPGPLQTSRFAPNLTKTNHSNSSSTSTASSSSSHASKTLTKPRAPNLGLNRSASAGVRGTSAPPPSTVTVRRTTTGAGAGAGVAGPSRVRVGSTATRPTRAAAGTSKDDPRRLENLEARLTSVETARLADSNRLAGILDAEHQKVEELEQNQQALVKQLATAKDEELNRRAELNIASDEIANLKKQHANEMMDMEIKLQRQERMLREAQEDLRVCREDLERERATTSTLKATMSHQSNSNLTLTAENTALKARDEARQSQMDADAQRIAELNRELEEERKKNAALNWEVMESEAVRRKLHNMVQELKGNIRVFCRVRPVLPSDLPETSSGSSAAALTTSTSTEDIEKLQEELTANMTFPDRRDHKEIVLRSSSESATGQERIETYAFSFDRVFEPESTQAQVFEEISMLAQSCIDGYNVCIFAYGQTGSGKSFTMEGGLTETTQGMIPRAVQQVFRGAEQLKAKGWEYKMEGQFLEIYNETINDLLGKGEFDKKKHEIKHDLKTGSTRVTDITILPLNSPSQVRTLLASAQSRRSVAATLMNERSSRSHSVFTLRISGTNASTGESCEGCLNLVDLAGSERINVSFGAGFGTGTGTGGSGSDKERLRETQSINKSLSALGDVIAALGEKGDKGDKHVPYRNSKLTYLLQNSLSGNSKTLMVLNLSPLAGHLNESLTSLRFATKVNNTTIGTAKKQIRGS
ncbi:hypothetical protein D9758_007622 [Tetrapyrgos nigripes]|uniref:Kinesin motor domain-containing protein n=1 Tax=Tetrapyrgos nigripes TaxID=182062 RepID=A0A8H5G7Y5_9AGAR|nr:hypothetical protein D9758_007622 [Tetrapyrgos nigripes]